MVAAYFLLQGAFAGFLAGLSGIGGDPIGRVKNRIPPKYLGYCVNFCGVAFIVSDQDVTQSVGL